MNHIKKFDELNEGKGRVSIKDKQVHTADLSLPQFWSTSPDYMSTDDTKTQEIGVDASQMTSPEGSGYAYLTDIDDHVDSNQVKKLMDPHIKKFNDFGFNPSEKTKTDKKK